jgi:hypothetical protein
MATSFASFSGVATRVIARTLEKLSCPRRSSSSISGKPPSACATRTFSRAGPSAMPQRNESQCAHESAPWRAQPSRVSNSRTSVSSRWVAASRLAAVKAMRSPRAIE